MDVGRPNLLALYTPCKLILILQKDVLPLSFLVADSGEHRLFEGQVQK